MTVKKKAQRKFKPAPAAVPFGIIRVGGKKFAVETDQRYASSAFANLDEFNRGNKRFDEVLRIVGGLKKSVKNIVAYFAPTPLSKSVFGPAGVQIIARADQRKKPADWLWCHRYCADGVKTVAKAVNGERKSTKEFMDPDVDARTKAKRPKVIPGTTSEVVDAPKTRNKKGAAKPDPKTKTAQTKAPRLGQLIRELVASGLKTSPEVEAELTKRGIDFHRRSVQSAVSRLRKSNA